MGLIRLVVFGFIALTVIYAAIWLYARSVRREKLEKHWDAEHPDGDDPDARQAFVAQGMAEYQAGFRPKLILLVYIVPSELVIAALVVTNWN